MSVMVIGQQQAIIAIFWIVLPKGYILKAGRSQQLVTRRIAKLFVLVRVSWQEMCLEGVDALKAQTKAVDFPSGCGFALSPHHRPQPSSRPIGNYIRLANP